LTPTLRIRVLVAAAAVVAAGTVVGVVLATGSNPPQPHSQCSTPPHPLIVPGVPSRAVGRVQAAFAAWPSGSLDRLQGLARAFPHDPVVRFNYGVALLCRGYIPDATQAFEAAKTAGRDTYYEMQSDSILHPQFFHPQNGIPYPVFQPSGNDPLLIRGVALQRQGHQHSAERLYAQAAKLHPDDADAQVAAAVGLFDEDNLSKSFSHLGPLVRRFPKAQTVRFHLGLLLAWTGQRTQAVTEFRRAKALGPSTTLGRQSSQFLAGLVTTGTNGGAK
jgi:tetratricopeptide (TPR) repeat protein